MALRRCPRAAVRGTELNTPTLTVRLSSPAPGVIGVHAAHLLGGVVRATVDQGVQALGAWRLRWVSGASVVRGGPRCGVLRWWPTRA